MLGSLELLKEPMGSETEIRCFESPRLAGI